MRRRPNKHRRARTWPGDPEPTVGTVTSNASVFETFTNEAVTPETILAFAAVLAMFEAVVIDGHYHSVDLFSRRRRPSRFAQTCIRAACVGNQVTRLLDTN